MNATVIAFTVMAAIAISFVAATLAREWGLRLPELTQKGDSSLGPQSVNWLAATAVIAAAWICLV